MSYVIIALAVILGSAIVGATFAYFVRARRLEANSSLRSDLASAAAPVPVAEEVEAIGEQIEKAMADHRFQGETQRQLIAQKLESVRTSVEAQKNQVQGLRSEFLHESRRRDHEISAIRSQIDTIQEAVGLPVAPSQPALPAPPAVPEPDDETFSFPLPDPVTASGEPDDAPAYDTADDTPFQEVVFAESLSPSPEPIASSTFEEAAFSRGDGPAQIEPSGRPADPAPDGLAASGSRASVPIDVPPVHDDAPDGPLDTFDEPTFDEPVFTTPDVVAPTVSAPVFEEPTFEEPTFEEPTFEEPTFEEPTFEPPPFDEPSYTEETFASAPPVAEEPALMAPEPTPQAVAADHEAALDDETALEETFAEAFADQSFIESPFADAPFADAPFADAPFADAPFADAPQTTASPLAASSAEPADARPVVGDVFAQSDPTPAAIAPAPEPVAQASPAAAPPPPPDAPLDVEDPFATVPLYDEPAGGDSSADLSDVYEAWRPASQPTRTPSAETSIAVDAPPAVDTQDAAWISRPQTDPVAIEQASADEFVDLPAPEPMPAPFDADDSLVDLDALIDAHEASARSPFAAPAPDSVFDTHTAPEPITAPARSPGVVPRPAVPFASGPYASTEPAASPAAETVADPAPAPAFEPAAEVSVPTAVTRQPVAPPVEPVHAMPEPVAEHGPEPIAQPEPAAQPEPSARAEVHVAPQPVVGPVAEAAPELAAEPAHPSSTIAPAPDAVPTPAPAPTTEAPPEPVAGATPAPQAPEVAAAPVESFATPAEPVTEPVVEAAPEPVAEPVTEPVAEPVTETVPPAATEADAGPDEPPFEIPEGAEDLTVIGTVDEDVQRLLYLAGVRTLEEIAQWGRGEARRIGSQVEVSEDTIMNQWVFEAQAALFNRYSTGG